MCAHRNSDNLHNAAFIGYSLVARVMADEHLVVVFHQIPESGDVIQLALLLKNALLHVLECVCVVVHRFSGRLGVHTGVRIAVLSR